MITRPANQDAVHSNDGAFGISAQLSPPLRPNDRVRVMIDGNLVPTVFRSANPRITPSDWDATALGAVASTRRWPWSTPWRAADPVAGGELYVHRAAVGGARR